MSDNIKSDGRRSLLKKAAGISVGIAAAGIAATQGARAAGMAKTAVKYQDTPKGGHRCDGCSLYIPGATAKANGTCKAVAGSIAPAGWCMLWTAKA